MFTELFLVVIKSNSIDWKGSLCLYSHWVGNVVRLDMWPDLVRSTVKRYLLAKLKIRKVTIKVSLDISFIVIFMNSFAYSIGGLATRIVDVELIVLVDFPVK